ncbi:MAG TPA: hypothetical protein VJ326_09180 [Thermoplasmata archaeon]|nr:hypothetical protein [Thermoplasmata archaeon]
MPNLLETATKEHGRWRMRERRLLDAIQELDEARRRTEAELSKVDLQIAYYDSLTRDMKREFGRPSLSGLLSSLRRT